VYLLGADAVVKRTSSLSAALWVSLSAAVALGAVALPLGGRPPDGTEWLTVSAMGVLTAAAFTFLFLGLRRVGAVRTAIIASLEPVATAILALWFLGEPLRPGVVLGGVLILGAAVTASLARRVPEPEAGVP
jgi:drug/metabolite transporter (DMT)-like permease